MKIGVTALPLWLATVAAILVGPGCGPTTKPAVKPPGWLKADLIGWRYVHRSGGYSNSCRFAESGEVYCILAKDPPPKTKPGQPPEAPIAPLFYWSIDDAGRLLITQMPDDPAPMWTWKLVSLNATSAKVVWDGKTLTLHREKRD